MRLAAAFAFAAVLFLSVVPSHAEKRVALVIGNGAYTSAPRLPNPRNDAEDVAVALKRSGFETIVGLDLDKTGMEDATIRFARAVRDADVALLYYSGHAMQFAGINYLMPIDAKLSDEADLRRMTRVDEVVADLQQARTVRILVLDSCRDNPLAEELKRSIGLSRAASMQRGLARIDTPQGMIVAFATQAGSTAADGSGRNSPYTGAFLSHIETPDEIGTVFRRISADVYEATKHAQLPELSLSLIGEYYLHGQPAAPAVVGALAAPPAVPPSPGAPASGTRPEEAARAWDAVKDSASIAILEAFIKQYGEGFYANFARARIEELKGASAAPRLPEPKPPVEARLTQPADPLRPELVTDCDRLAANPRDAQRPNSVAGLTAGRIDIAPALAACNEAVGKYPDVARFHYQAGRVASAQKDYGRARQFYERAAAMGSVAAMTNLGLIYRSGLGVRKDYIQARQWLEKATAAGDRYARDILEELNRDGQGAAQDYVAPRGWYERGHRRGW
jgi:tetratricopeptide (TPR) repeat protein